MEEEDNPNPILNPNTTSGPRVLTSFPSKFLSVKIRNSLVKSLQRRSSGGIDHNFIDDHEDQSNCSMNHDDCKSREVAKNKVGLILFGVLRRKKAPPETCSVNGGIDSTDKEGEKKKKKIYNDKKRWKPYLRRFFDRKTGFALFRQKLNNNKTNSNGVKSDSPLSRVPAMIVTVRSQKLKIAWWMRKNSAKRKDRVDKELCKKRILMGERCKPLNHSGKLEYDKNGILLPQDIVS